MASAVVAGASGYAGALAARLLYTHPEFELTAVTSRSDAGVRLDELYPYHRVPLTLDAFDVDELDGIEAAIVAYPHGASAPVVQQLHDRGVRVVDLSADFRLRDPATYAEWYGEHGAPSLFGHAVYGLPELYRDQIRDAHLVANPGCFPTAAILALAPIADLIEDVVIDAKTGVSGAGRAATAKTHFVTVTENVNPYGVPRHRHTPEIEQELGTMVQFTPHLLPIDQGELVSCYVTPRSEADVGQIFRDAYADEPFVELTDTLPGVREVRDTNLCRIFATTDERTGRILVFAAIDNLWKGAASQAVQNLNLMFGFDETTGLE